MAGGVTDTDRGFSNIMRALNDLAGEPISVLVGVSGTKNSDMVIIAASNEFGTEDGHIPERSFVRSTVDDGASEIADDLEAVIDAVLDGSDIDTRLGLVGEKWVGKIKQKIRDIDTPPNAPSTIARKGSDNPLIDGGRLRNSITWQIERGG